MLLGSVILEWFLHLKIRIDGKGMQPRCLLNTFRKMFLGMSYRKEIQGKTHHMLETWYLVVGFWMLHCLEFDSFAVVVLFWLVWVRKTRTLYTGSVLLSRLCTRLSHIVLMVIVIALLHIQKLTKKINKNWGGDCFSHYLFQCHILADYFNST